MDVYLTGLYTHLLPAGCVFLAAFLQSITGFGLVIVAAPLLMFFYDVKLTIVIMMLLACCGNLTQSFLLHKKARWSLIGWLIVGSLIAQPIGFLIYYFVPGDPLKLIISLLVIFSMSFLHLLHRKIAETRRNSIISGMLAGFMAITTGMAAPPIAVYFSHSGMPPQNLRATCIGYFFLSNIVSLTTFLLGNVPMAPALSEFIYLLPGLALGILTGNLLFRLIPAVLFKRIILILLYAACIYNICTVLF